MAQAQLSQLSKQQRYELCLIHSDLEQNQDVWLIGDETTLEFQRIRSGNILDYAAFDNATGSGSSELHSSGQAMTKPVELEGFLLKRGSKGVVLSWKRRFFRIQDNRLLYFEKEPLGTTEPLGYISLGAKTTIQETFAITDVDSTLLIEISTPMRVWYLQADTTADRDIWMAGLTQSVRYWQNTEKNWLEGYLTKRGGIWKNWLVRWCILRSDFLYYYEAKDNSYYLKGKIPLYAATVLTQEESNQAKIFRGRTFGFSIATVSGDRTYYLCANSQAHRDEWVSRLRTNIYALEEKISQITVDV